MHTKHQMCHTAGQQRVDSLDDIQVEVSPELDTISQLHRPGSINNGEKELSENDGVASDAIEES